MSPVEGKLVAAICHAFMPMYRDHWRDWPGTQSFAIAALRAIEAETEKTVDEIFGTLVVIRPEPCPFCGSENILAAGNDNYVQCLDCMGTASNLESWNRRA